MPLVLTTVEQLRVGDIFADGEQKFWTCFGEPKTVEDGNGVSEIAVPILWTDGGLDVRYFSPKQEITIVREVL